MCIPVYITVQYGTVMYGVRCTGVRCTGVQVYGIFVIIAVFLLLSSLLSLLLLTVVVVCVFFLGNTLPAIKMNEWIRKYHYFLLTQYVRRIDSETAKGSTPPADRPRQPCSPAKPCIWRHISAASGRPRIHILCGGGLTVIERRCNSRGRRLHDVESTEASPMPPGYRMIAGFHSSLDTFRHRIMHTVMHIYYVSRYTASHILRVYRTFPSVCPPFGYFFPRCHP